MVFCCQAWCHDDRTIEKEYRTHERKFKKKFRTHDRKIEKESSTQSKSTVFSNNFRVYTIFDLKAATKNFHSSLKIDDDRYGGVYKGMVNVNSLENCSDKIQVAVKYLKGITKEYEDWLADVNFLGMVEHPNLVKLVGYCVYSNQIGMRLFFVYDYMTNKSVRHHLSTKSETPLSWTMRLKVAQDAARGLAYLHEGMEIQILFRDFNSSKLLLDDQWNAKLSDLGATQIGSQEGDTDEFIASGAYTAPEYIQNGHMSSKSDVWSYGVFLYELITGRQARDKSRPESEQNLLEWVKPYVQSKNLQPLIDPRLEGTYSMKSAQALVTIADLCLKSDPKSRLQMSEVLELLNVVTEALSQVISSGPVPNVESVNGVIGVPSQVTNPAPAPESIVPVIPVSKLLRCWFIKAFCCVCIANNK